MPPSPCPDENLLLRAALGRCAEAELAAVEAHLDGCDGCRQVLAAAASQGESPKAQSNGGLRPGDQVGRYTVEEILGLGAMGVVYAARDPTLARRVALKLLRDSEDAASGARLRREAQSMAQLSHPNVVPVFDLGEWEGRLFLAMELVDGSTLEALRRSAPPRAVLLQAHLESGRGLAAAHAAGVVHRDFKPANVLIGRDGRARVTDFGLARAGPAAPESLAEPGGGPGPVDLTRTGALLGTLAYMSPEQLAGATSDARSDQFAWCIALVESLTGRRPFDGATAAELAASIARGPRLTGVPRGLRSVLARGLSPRPEARFPSMEALLAAVESARRRWIPWSIAAAVATAAGLLAAGVGAFHRSASPARAASDAPAAATPLTLKVGHDKLVDAKGLQRVAVGDPSVIDVKVIGDDQLLVVGLAPGSTSLILWESGQARHEFDVEVSAQ